MSWNYSNTSVQTTLSAPVAPGDTTITIVDTTGLPVSFPFSLILDYQLATVEIVTVTNLVGSTLTVTRGQDGTSAQSHSVGGPVVHGVVARDVNEPQLHIAAISNVHGTGVGANVVGTSTSQTLTNKTISGSSNTITNIADSSILSLAATKITGSFTTITATGAGSFGSLTVTGSSTLAAVTATTIQASGVATLQAGTTITGGAISIQRTVASSTVFDANVTGDTNPRHHVQADGATFWGPGNAALDASLSRSGTNVLLTNSELDFTVPNSSFDYLDCRITGDSTERFAVHADGKHRWGPGNAATDTVLYRNSAGELKTDTNLTVGGNLVVSGIGQQTTVYKTSDQTVNNSSSLTNDTQLTVAVVANAVYRLESHFWFNSNTTANFKWQYAIPTAATYSLGVTGYDITGVLVSNGNFDQTIVLTAQSGGVDKHGSVYAIVTIGANAGNVVMKWAQNTANASNTIVRAGSHMTLTRIA